MIKVEERDTPLFILPDDMHIACLRCKWGCIDYLAIKCAKYPEHKPHDVYFGNAECPKFEKR